MALDYFLRAALSSILITLGFWGQKGRVTRGHCWPPAPVTPKTPKTMRIKFDEYLPQWNYKAIPLAEAVP